MPVPRSVICATGRLRAACSFPSPPGGLFVSRTRGRTACGAGRSQNGCTFPLSTRTFMPGRTDGVW